MRIIGKSSGLQNIVLLYRLSGKLCVFLYPGCFGASYFIVDYSLAVKRLQRHYLEETLWLDSPASVRIDIVLSILKPVSS